MNFMRAAILAIFAFLLALSPANAAPSDYEGYYWNEAKDGIFRLELVGESIQGITVWGKEPRTDSKNPDPALRNRSLAGITFLTGFTYDEKKDRWSDGKVYDPDTGKTYDAKMELIKDGKLLKMRGFIGVSLFGRTARFERVSSNDLPTGVLE